MESKLISSTHPFIAAWGSAFAQVGKSAAESAIDPVLWEGSAAVDELRNSGWLDFVQPVDDLMDLASLMLFRYVVREIEIYREVCDSDVRRDQEVAEVLGVLKRVEERLLVSRKTTGPQDLKGIFAKLASIVSQEKSSLEESKGSYWEQQLVATRSARNKWLIDMEELREVIPRELLQVEEIFSNVSFPRKLIRRSDVDKRFQIRTATILRRYLADVSLETLSRLVVLCYLCGGLATVIDGAAYIRAAPSKATIPAKRELTVGAVYQKLKDQTSLKRCRGTARLSNRGRTRKRNKFSH